MSRQISFLYGVLCYGLFLVVFLYFIGFVTDMPLPKTVSSGTTGALAPALAVDLALILLFGLQHSIMARSGFKRWLTNFVSPSVERSTYVLATNLVFIVLFVFWQPLPGCLWQLDGQFWVAVLFAVSAAGWLLALLATFLTNHFDLFGLRQVHPELVKKAYMPVPFKEILLYRWIRHPMMLGLLIAIWATPWMTTSHLLFALGMTVYIVIGIHFEEVGLQAQLGQPYREYQKRTACLLPFY